MKLMLHVLLLSQQRFSSSIRYNVGAISMKAEETFVGIAKILPTNMPISTVGSGAEWSLITVPGFVNWR